MNSSYQVFFSIGSYILYSHTPVWYSYQNSFVTNYYQLLCHILYQDTPNVTSEQGNNKDTFAGNIYFIYQFKEKKIICTFRNMILQKQSFADVLQNRSL